MSVVWEAFFMGGWGAIPSSVIDLVRRGTGGVLTIDARLYITDINGTPIEDITLPMTRCVVDMNVDRQVKMQASFLMDGEGIVDYLKDYLTIYMLLEYEDGTSIAEPVGTFVADLPDDNVSPFGTEVAFEAHDLTWLLQNSAFSDTYNIAAGTNYVTAVTTIIQSVGITRINIPATTKTLAEAISYDPGFNKLEAVNELLNAIAYYTLYMDRDATVSSMPYRDISLVEPLATYNGDDFLSDIVIVPSKRQIPNVIIVKKDNPNEAPLISIARNDDANSKTSTVATGREVTRVFQADSLVSQTEADTLSAMLIKASASLYRTIKFDVDPSPYFGIHETIDIDEPATDIDLQGRYWVRTWKMGFTPKDGVLTLECNQLVTY